MFEIDLFPVQWKILSIRINQHGLTIQPYSSISIYGGFREMNPLYSTYKPSHWFRYMVNMFVIWPHGKESFGRFLD